MHGKEERYRHQHDLDLEKDIRGHDSGTPSPGWLPMQRV